MFKLDWQSRVPIYRQLVQQIMQYVALDVLKPGDALPSVRNLARDLAINPNTVAKAYQELERAEIINSVGGKGSFVSKTADTDKVFRDGAREALKDSAQKAKYCGIALEEAVETVEKAYGEGAGL